MRSLFDSPRPSKRAEMKERQIYNDWLNLFVEITAFRERRTIFNSLRGGKRAPDKVQNPSKIHLIEQERIIKKWSDHVKKNTKLTSTNNRIWGACWDFIVQKQVSESM